MKNDDLQVASNVVLVQWLKFYRHFFFFFENQILQLLKTKMRFHLRLKRFHWKIFTVQCTSNKLSESLKSSELQKARLHSLIEPSHKWARSLRGKEHSPHQLSQIFSGPFVYS